MVKPVMTPSGGTGAQLRSTAAPLSAQLGGSTTTVTMATSRAPSATAALGGAAGVAAGEGIGGVGGRSLPPKQI